MDTLIYICQTKPLLRLLAGLLNLLTKLFKLFLIHAHTIIPDSQTDNIALFFPVNVNTAFGTFIFDSMVKCILHHWLKGQFQNLIFINHLIQLNVIFQNIPITHLLNLEVTADVFFFFLNGNKFLPFAEDFTEKVRQCNNHGHRFVRLIGLDQPHNGVQRIIKKMRLDLLLKKAQICFSHFPLVFLHLIDQRLHASCHFVKAHCKLSHLILGIRLGSGIKITLSDFLRSLVQLTDRLYNTGNDHHRADCNHNDQHADQHTAHHHKPPDLILQGIRDLVHITCLIINIILNIVLD